MGGFNFPPAAAKLDKLSQALGKYVAGAPAMAASTAGVEPAAGASGAADGSMSRGEGTAAEVDLQTPLEGFPDLAEGQVAIFRWGKAREGSLYRKVETDEQ